MRPVLELLWYSQPALHIAIGTAAAKRPCIWPSIHPCRIRPTLCAVDRLSFVLNSLEGTLESSGGGPCANSLFRGWDAGHQAVAVFGAARPAVAHGELHLPQLAEVIEIATRRDAADTSLVRHRGRRQA